MNIEGPQLSGKSSARREWLRWVGFFITRPVVLIAALGALCAIVIGTVASYLDTRMNQGLIVTASMFTGILLAHVIAATTGAWLGYRERRFRLDVLTTPGEGGLNRARSAMVTAGVVAFGGAVLLAGVALSLAMLFVPYRSGSIDPALLCAAAAMVSLSFLLGFGAGLAVPRVLTVPAAGLLMYLVASGLASGQGTAASMLLPSAGTGSSAFVRWNHVTTAAQVLWFIGAVALVATLLVYGRRVRMAAVTSATLALTLLVASAAVLAHEEWQRLVPLAVNGVAIPGASCGGDELIICLPSEYEGMRGELTGAFSPLIAKLSQAHPVATTLELRPRGIGQVPTPGAQAIHLDSARPGDSAVAVSEYVESLLDVDQCFSPAGQEAQPWESIVFDWLVEAPQVPEGTEVDGDDPALQARQWFAGLDEASKREWFRNHFAAFTECQLASTDFDAQVRAGT